VAKDESFAVPNPSRSDDQPGHGPNVRDLFPNREWENTTQESRQTALELWQNSGCHEEPPGAVEKGVLLATVNSDEIDVAIEHSPTVNGNGNDIAVNDIVEEDTDKGSSSADPPATDRPAGCILPSESSEDKVHQSDKEAVSAVEAETEQDVGNDGHSKGTEELS
jgi:hypothetical protein